MARHADGCYKQTGPERQVKTLLGYFVATL